MHCFALLLLLLRITDVISLHRHHRSGILQEVRWNERPENKPHSQLLGEEDYEQIERRAYISNGHGHTGRIPVDVLRREDEHSQNIYESSNHVKTKNKWGFNQNCEVVCKKDVCYGWGPSPDGLCKRGNYKHKCCDIYRPIPEGTSGNVHPEDHSIISITIPIKTEKVPAIMHTTKPPTTKSPPKKPPLHLLTTKHSTPKPKPTTTVTTTTPKPPPTTTKPTEKPKITAPPSICTKYSISPTTCTTHKNCDYSCDMKECVLKSRDAKEDKDLCKTHQCLLGRCSCRGCDLAYNSATNACEVQQDLCKNLKFSNKECLRSNQYYAYAGVICKSDKEDSGNCLVEETILAVNLGTRIGEGPWIDSRNITHLSDESVPFSDPYKTKWVSTGLPKNTLAKSNVLAEDRIFYETITHGDVKLEGHDRCLIYTLRILHDGRYQLAVKLVHLLHRGFKQRMFNIRLNEVDVIAELYVEDYASDKNPAIEIFLNFEVAKSGSVLLLPGFKELKIDSGHMNLSFCYGRCKGSTELVDYMVAAFSLVKFANLEDSESKKCSTHKGNSCTSRKYACEYNVVTGESMPSRNCPKSWFDDFDCIRKNTFYLHGGVLCQNKENSGGDCKIAETILAVNMNGPRHGPDSRGITYHSQKEKPPKDPNSTGKLKSVEKVSGAEAGDQLLYTTYMYGDGRANNTNPDNCIFWVFPVTSDGFYEMSIKTAEFYYSQHGSRTFNVKVDGQRIIDELDLLALAPKGTAVDIIVNFEILGDGTILHLRGHPMKETNGKVKIEFCYGGCKTEDRNWMLGALYVVRFKDEEKGFSGL